MSNSSTASTSNPLQASNRSITGSSVFVNSRNVLSTPSSTPFPFNGLPVELLIAIFKRGDLTSWSEIDDQQHSLPFPVVVSHVCRHWRNVALEATTLWSDIYFCEYSSLANQLAHAFWERSRDSLVDVRYYTYGSSRPDFLVNCLLPQFKRVRRLSIMVAHRHTAHRSMGHFAHIDAPDLKMLSISTPLQVYPSYASFASEAHLERFTLFNGYTPVLRSVSLSVHPGLFQLKFSNLTSLTFRMEAIEHQVTLHQFLNILTDISKTLIRLGVAETVFHDDLKNADNPPIELPALKSLSLCEVYNFPILHTPILEHLYLSNVDDVTMNTFIKGWSSSDLSTLSSLTLHDIDLSCFATNRPIFRGLSNVDELVVWNCRSEVDFMSLLNEENGEKEVDIELMPRLYSLAISGPLYGWSLLRSILSSRIAKGAPIKLVRFRDMPEAHCLDWLAQRNIHCECGKMRMDSDINELFKEEERHDRMRIHIDVPDEDDWDSYDSEYDSEYERDIWDDGDYEYPSDGSGL